MSEAEIPTLVASPTPTATPPTTAAPAMPATPTKYILFVEGQNVDLPPEIAQDDERVRQAMAPFFPDAANAEISRATAVDGTVTISVVRRAGLKGLFPAPRVLEQLRAAPNQRNPVYELHALIAGRENLEGLSPLQLLCLDGYIAWATERGDQQRKTMQEAARRLRAGPSRPAPFLAVGF